MTDQNQLLTTDEAATYLHVTKQTLAKWRSKGPHKIPYQKRGKYVFYRKSDLDRFNEENTEYFQGATD